MTGAGLWREEPWMGFGLSETVKAAAGPPRARGLAVGAQCIVPLRELELFCQDFFEEGYGAGILGLAQPEHGLLTDFEIFVGLRYLN
jgi:hypothetical protein